MSCGCKKNKTVAQKIQEANQPQVTPIPAVPQDQVIKISAVLKEMVDKKEGQ